MLENTLNEDLKRSLLAGDSFTTTALRTLKSTILYAKVAAGTRGQDMPDAELIALLQKEARKRQESADLYRQGGSEDRAVNELREKEIIERYLPQQRTEAEITAMVDAAIGQVDVAGPAAMGAVIAAVKREAAGSADGALIARIAKQRLNR